MSASSARATCSRVVCAPSVKRSVERARSSEHPIAVNLKLDGPFDAAAPATPVLGISYSPVPEVLRDQLELGTGGMVVEQVVEKSLAEKLGLAKNDVLLEVQGKPVASAPDVRAALEDAKDGEKVTALVVRKGQRKTLETTK